MGRLTKLAMIVLVLACLFGGGWTWDEGISPADQSVNGWTWDSSAP